MSDAPTPTDGGPGSAMVRRNPPFSPRRVGAMVLRYIYLIRGSWPRIVEMAYWPTVQMILWGFITLFLIGHSSFIAQAFGILLSGVLLWDVLFPGTAGRCHVLPRGDVVAQSRTFVCQPPAAL